MCFWHTCTCIRTNRVCKPTPLKVAMKRDHRIYYMFVDSCWSVAKYMWTSCSASGVCGQESSSSTSRFSHVIEDMASMHSRAVQDIYCLLYSPNESTAHCMASNWWLLPVVSMGPVMMITIIATDHSPQTLLPSVSTSSRAAISLPHLFRSWLVTRHAF